MPEQIADYEWEAYWDCDPLNMAETLNECAPGWLLHDIKIDKTAKGDDGYLIVVKRRKGGAK